MNEHPKTEIEELFSASLDGELTQRQETELKRLLQNEPQMVEQLAALRRQRELLCALPVETAPPSLAEDIRAQLERKLILQNTSQTQSFWSRAALLRRRFVAAAAMLLLPLGLLGIVVYHIVTPASDTPTGSTTARGLLEGDLILPPLPPETTTLAAALPFDGILTLTTQRPLPADQLIKKQIFVKAMENRTIRHQTPDVIRFEIDCAAERMADFIASLSPLWAQLTDSRLTLRDTDAAERTTTIPHILPDQIQRLVQYTDKTPMLSAARLYASGNAPLRQETDQVPLPLTPEDLVIPQPFLASPEPETPQQPTDNAPTVRLTIELRQAE